MSEMKFTKEFRESVLALLVQDGDFLKQAAGIVKPEHFEEHLHIFTAESILKSYMKSNQAPSRAVLMNDLTNALLNETNIKDLDTEKRLALKPAEEFITRIFTPFEGRSDDIKTQYLEFAKNQEMKNAALRIYNSIETGETDYNQAMSDLRRTYLNVINNTEDIGIDFFADLPDVQADMLKLRQKVYTTGFKALDDAMEGGLTGGTLTVFIAPPKGGKSMVLINTAVANLNRTGRNIVVFTLEISQRKLQRRYLARISGVPMHELNPRIDEVQKTCVEFWERSKSRLFIKEYPTGGASVGTLRSYLYRLQANTNISPDMIIVDYGDIVRSGGKYNDERFAQKAVYEELRALASEFNCPVVTASQVNRQAVNKALIKMDDIAEAFAKCQVADHIVSVCQTELEAQEHKGRLYIAGSREARSGVISNVNIDWHTCRITEDSFRQDQNEEKWEPMSGIN